MNKSSIYLETTVISYLTSKPSNDFLIAANQEVTKQWWSQRKGDFIIFISDIVVDEIQRGDPLASKERVDLVKDIDLLLTSEEALELSAKLIERILPKKARSDALHIAIAALNGVDYLLTWNFRHIANAEMRNDIINACNTFGYECPIICSPSELLGAKVYD